MAGRLVYFFGTGWAQRAMPVLRGEGSLQFYNPVRETGEPNRPSSVVMMSAAVLQAIHAAR